ncbi:hypothetical protein FSP39_024455 [Pinctada imbricata]|uniref:SH3 domain-containing protein n=1 Tax=Pinctada imbricata TaxID=66713 RepID=A0AA88YF74_PINIB|nr:hypothetical protein FSP39_024455 [Pinctada imbricata]
MFRALYNYNSTIPEYLSFEKGDKFTALRASHGDWIQVENGFGEIGYVPRNYVVEETDAALSEVLQSIDRAIQNIHYQSAASGNYSHQQRENLHQYCMPHTNVIQSVQYVTYNCNKTHNNGHFSVTDTVENGWVNVSHGSRGTADRDSKDTVDSKLMDSTKEKSCEDSVLDEAQLTGRDSKDVQHKHSSDTDEHNIQQSSLVTSTDSVSSSQVMSPARSIKSIPSSPSRLLASPSIINMGNLPMPSNLASEIIEEVRKHTGLSYDKSGLAVEVVLGHIASRLPQTAALMDKIMTTVTETGSTSDEEESYDAKRIEELFTKLTACKDDSQQRSWALYEDQQNILTNLEELLSILENAKPSICRRAVSRNNYDSIHNLVQYYQMESRVVLRLSLLKVFGAMCTLEAALISHLLYSILPIELVSEIQTQYEDSQRLSFVTLLLTMILCTGEPTPLNLQEQMDQSFWDFVIDQIESPCSTDHEDQCTDLLVHLILAYNVHILDVKENIIMTTLGHKGTAKVFTEKLLLIFNRGDDPVRMFDYQTSQPNSVMKFMQDLYSQQSTATLLYTNDAKVLIDIIIRQLTDLQSEDQMRSSYLTLTKLLVMNSDYFEHEHRLAELCERLMAINKEEAAPENDKEEATLILEEFNSHL